MRLNSISGISLCFLLAVVVFAAAQERLHHGDYEYWEFSDKFEQSLEGIDKINFRTRNSSFRILTWDNNEISIDIVKKIRSRDRDFAEEIAEKINLGSEQDGSVLRIWEDVLTSSDYKGRDSGWSYYCNLEIRIPAHLSLNIDTSNGSVFSEEIAGTLEVTSSNGSITLETCSNYAELDTNNGSITVDKTTGTLNAHTNNGKIELVEVGGKVKAHTNNGKVEAELADTLTGDVYLRTNNGQVTLRMNRTQNLHLVADSGAFNKIILDFPITISPGEIRKGYIESTFGKGGHTVHLRTTNGSIHIEEK